MFSRIGPAAFAVATMGFATARAADTYVIDPEHTHVMFRVERFGLSHTLGSFVDVEGVVVLDQDAPEKSRVEATMKTASVDSNNATREEHLRGELWFDAAQFPLVAFKSTDVDATGENTAKVTGDLTVHGVTKSVTLDVALNAIGTDPVSQRAAAGFTAKGAVNRHDFAMNTADALIGADVEILIEALAIAPAN